MITELTVQIVTHGNARPTLKMFSDNHTYYLMKESLKCVK